MAINALQVAEKIDRLKREVEKNKGRLVQIDKEIEKRKKELKSLFGINTIKEAKNLLIKKEEELKKKEAKLQEVLNVLDKTLRGENG